MDKDKLLTVEVVYALPDEQVIIVAEIALGSNVRQAIEHTDILQRFPQIDLEKDKVGIFSRVCKLDRVLEQGDRVEIYRSLLVDPKEKRRRRAASNKSK